MYRLRLAISVVLVCTSATLLTWAINPSDSGPTSSPKPKVAMLVKASRSFDGDVRHLTLKRPAKTKRPKPEHEPPDEDVYLAGDHAAVGSGVADSAVAAPTPSTSFDGLHYTESCLGGGCGDGHPPDTNGDVGPTYYIQTINTAIGIYNKTTGARVAGFTFDNLMSQGNFGNLCDTDNFGDPVVLYDTFADRWIITDFAFILNPNDSVASPPGAFQCFAVSKTGDPVSGGWNYYSINITDSLADYPKFGVWSDGIYMAANLFGFAANASFQNVRVWAFNKEQMYAGLPTVQSVSFDAPSKIQGVSVFTLLPSNARVQTGAPPTGRENLFASIWGFTSRVRVWKFHVDWANPASSTFTGPNDSFTSTTWSSAPGFIPEKDGNDLDSLAPRLMVQNEYTNIGGAESLWDTHTVAGSSSSQAAVRWYQVGVTGGNVGSNVIQAATWNPDSRNRFMPSLAVDRMGNMAVGYTVSDATIYPAIRYAGRLASDTANTFSQTETSLIEGTGGQVHTFSDGSLDKRWGDYSSMTLDPDGCTFWYTNEYYVTNGFDDHTRIGSFRFPQCTPIATGALQGTVRNAATNDPISGATVSVIGDPSSVLTDSNGFYIFPSHPVGTFSVSASAAGFNSTTVNGVVVNQNITTVQDFSLNAAPPNGCLTDTTKADFDSGAASSVDTAASPGDVKLTFAQGGDALDQQQTQTSGTAFSPDYEAQTFKAGLTGQLTKADVYLATNSTAPVTVGIYNTNGGVPTGSAIATATINPVAVAQFFTATFSTPAMVTAGSTYAVVLFRSGGSFWVVCSNGGSNCTSTYLNGNAYTSTNGTSWTVSTTKQTAFRTYVSTSSGYVTAGNFVSAVKDSNPVAGTIANWTTLSWTNASLPAGTSLQFQVAGSNNATGPFTFVGPNGTAATFFTTSGADLAQFHGLRYLKYKAFLATTNTANTPTLNDVTICFNNNPLTTTTLSPATASGSYGGTTNLSATLTAGGNAVPGKSVSFTLNGSPVGSGTTDSNGTATVNNVTLAGINAGSYPTGVAASFAGDSTYAMSGGTNSLTVNPADQTISFTLQQSVAVSAGSLDLNGTATSGFAVLYQSSNTSVAAISIFGTSLNLLAPGSTTITATQPGNSNYNPAPSIPHDLVVTGPIATNDMLTRPPNSNSLRIPVGVLLSNDSRVAFDGSIQTDNLSVTNVTAGTGDSVQLSGDEVIFTPDTPSSTDSLSFNYDVSDGTSTASASVAVDTSNGPALTLALIQVTTPTYSVGDDSTSTTATFQGAPNQTYSIDYATSIGAWTSTGAPVNTTATGLFMVTITAPGNQTALWSKAMFFRATIEGPF